MPKPTLFERIFKAAGILKYSESSGFGDAYAASSIFTTGSGTLSPVIAKDLGYLGEGLPASVWQAMAVPPINRAIALLSTAASQVTIPDGAPAWLRAGTGSISPEARLVSIVQDLIFHRESVVLVTRDGDGKIAEGIRLPYEYWDLDIVGNVQLNGKAVPDQSQFVYISSFMPLGLLEAAAHTIEHYLDLQQTIRSRSRNPIPLVELHITEEFDGEPSELTDALADWTAARQAEDGAVAFTPKGIELKTPGAGLADDGAMLIGARNAARLDAANFTNLPASMLEGANGASGTYENTLQSRDEFVSLSLAQWLRPIEARFNMPDVADTEAAPWRFGDEELTPNDAAAKGNLGTAVPPTDTIQGEITA